ncbi:MAG: hypothetical protein JW731_04150 [Bacteroidales bacterium]|nr:hypothetical protein [Bacteroidales bacterium]
MEKIDKEELIVTTLFKMERLKQTLRNETNLSLLDYLESYKYMIQILNQAAAADDSSIFNEKLTRLLNYSYKMIEFSNKGNHCLLNIREAEEILMEIQQCLHLLKTWVVDEKDESKFSVKNRNNPNLK